MRRISLRVLTFCVVMACLGCETLKPYEKEYLLDPLMDDNGVRSLEATVMNQASLDFEKLAGGAPGAASATSCPTCGG